MGQMSQNTERQTKARSGLAVEMPPDWLDRLGHFLGADGHDLQSVSHRALGPELLINAPDLLVSPLIGDGFDAVELARNLVQWGFAGRYIAVAERLPDGGLIRREVQKAAPRLDFTLILLDGPNRLRVV